MIVGNFGKMVFSVSKKKVNSFSNLKFNKTAEWSEHKRYGKKPISEFISPGLISFTLDIHLDANLGVNPRTELDKWTKYLESGHHDVFVIGGKQIGKYEWKIENISEAWNTIMGKGKLIAADLTITMSEYIDIDKPKPKAAKSTVKADNKKEQKVSVTSLVKGQTYKVKTILTGYYTSLEAKNLTAVNRTGKVYPGTYYIFNLANGMINVTRVKGSPGSWINPTKNR